MNQTDRLEFPRRTENPQSPAETESPVNDR